MIFQARPLRLRAGHLTRAWLVAALVALLGAGLLAVAVFWQGSEIAQLRHEEAIWANGDPAKDASVEGHETSRQFILNSYDLNVTYVDAHGRTHVKKLEFDTLFAGVDQHDAVLVRYDQSNADDFALSWAMDTAGWRWGAIAFFLLVFGGGGLLCIWGAFAVVRRGYDARRAGEDGEEVELAVIEIAEQIVNGRATGNVIYRYRAPGDAEGKKREVLLNPKKAIPLFLDDAKKRMLALRSPRNQGRLVVVNADLSPFAFTADEEKAIRERIDARRNEIGAAMSQG